jgi:uncharacterized protein
LFANLAAAETQPRFFARVADDVDWTVMGTHPLAGHYVGKQKFIDATFARLARVLQDGAELAVRNLLIDGDTVVAELASTSISNEGAPFDNLYCWVCRSTATHRRGPGVPRLHDGDVHRAPQRADRRPGRVHPLTQVAARARRRNRSRRMVAAGL